METKRILTTSEPLRMGVTNLIIIEIWRKQKHSKFNLIALYYKIIYYKIDL